MEIRPIDANQLYRIEKLLDTDIVKKDKVASELLEQVLYDIQHMPTLTPQNEWISVEDRLPEPGDLIVYADNTVWGYQYGICRVCGKEKAFDYWMPLQDPPNNRPPEGEEDT